MRAGQVAKECHVTTQAVGVWVRENGCPVEMVDELGTRWFDLAKVRAWVSANRPRALAKQHGGGHGGQRANSGRRPAADVQRIIGGDDAHPLLRERSEERGRTTTTELEPESLLTQENRRLKAAQARKHELDVLERERTLVKMSEVEEAIGQAARNVRVRLETMAARLTGQILTAIRLGPEHGPVLQDLVQTACDEVLAEMVEDPLGMGDIARVAA